MNYLLLILLSISSLSSPEKHNSISAVVQTGYAVGYGFNKAEAYGDAIRNTPSGVISYPAQFIKIGLNKYGEIRSIYISVGYASRCLSFMRFVHF